MFEVATDVALLLALAALFAGIIDSIAGGGGLITVPALLLAGLDPVTALATNKLGGAFGSGSATLSYASRGMIDIRKQWPAALASVLGGCLGAMLATVLPSQWLRGALPLILIATALYFALKPNLDDVDRASRTTPFFFGLTVVPAIAFYDGLFGPGTGSFFMIAFVSLLGFGVLKATAHTKLLNFGSNIGSLVTFIFAGAILWKVGLAMGAAQFVGARIGSNIAVRVGSRLIKPLLVVVCVALAIRLLMDPANPLRTAIGI
jgi:uncharacterized membrane protein YfcA